jgi:hypothetical protein
MSRVMDMACVALPCLLLPARRPPGEPEDMVWADSVASLFTAAARRATTLSKHVVNARTALHSRRRILGRAIRPDASEDTCCRPPELLLQTHGFDSPINIARRAALQSRYIFRLRQY